MLRRNISLQNTRIPFYHFNSYLLKFLISCEYLSVFVVQHVRFFSLPSANFTEFNMCWGSTYYLKKDFQRINVKMQTLVTLSLNCWFFGLPQNNWPRVSVLPPNLIIFYEVNFRQDFCDLYSKERLLSVSSQPRCALLFLNEDINTCFANSHFAWSFKLLGIFDWERWTCF